MGDDIKKGGAAKDKLWTADELFAYIDAVHTLDVEFRGRIIRVHYKELEACEVPDISDKSKRLDPNLSDEEKQARIYQFMMHEKAWAMIEKAQRENPEKCDVIWSRQDFDRWPDTVKGAVCMELWGLTEKVAEHFSGGLRSPQKPSRSTLPL